MVDLTEAPKIGANAVIKKAYYGMSANERRGEERETNLVIQNQSDVFKSSRQVKLEDPVSLITRRNED